MHTPTLTKTHPTLDVLPGQRNAVRIAFAIPWIIFGIQHYMYADFVKTLVPAYVPWKLFWTYFTGTAMILAGISFIIRRQVQLAAFLLGSMLLLFILMLHTVILSGDPQGGIHWTRAMQDTAIMASAFALAIVSGAGWPGRGLRAVHGDGGSWRAVTDGDPGEGIGTGATGSKGWRGLLASPRAPVVVRYAYALPLVVLGVQHFTHNAFVTAKIPTYFPWISFWDYVVGVVLIAAAYGLLFTSRIRWTASTLGIILIVLALLQHVPMFVSDAHNGFQWTGSMLDLALAAGAFIIGWTADR